MPVPPHLHLQHFFSQTSERIYCRDQNYKMIWASRNFLNDAGKESVDALTSEKIGEILPQLASEITDIIDDVESNVFQTQQSRTRTHLMRNEGVALKTVSIQCHPVFGEAGDFTGVVSQYRIEAAASYLGYEKTLIDSLMRSTQDAIFFKDLDSKFIRVSHSMIERLGVDSMEDIIGKSDFDFWAPECAGGFVEDEQNIIATGEPTIGRCEEITRHDGHKIWIISSKMPLVDEFGNVIGTFGINKDITELKQTELKLEATHEQLVVASRQAGMAEIATNVIHNVGNVLNSIGVSIATGRSLIQNQSVANLSKAADLLEANCHKNDYFLNDPKGRVLPGFFKLSATTLANTQEKVLDEFDNLRKHVEHVTNIVSMQQEYAVSQVVYDEVNIASLVDDAIQLGEGVLERSGVKVVRNYSRDAIACVEKHKLLQILINLIRNAKHACEDAPGDREKEIVIGIESPAEGFFTVEVADNGIGISPDNLTRIFHHGFTTKRKGKGFGLHSSANTAREMGGSLIATSAGLGNGASFVLTFPKNSKQRRLQVGPIRIGETAEQSEQREVTALDVANS